MARTSGRTGQLPGASAKTLRTVVGDREVERRAGRLICDRCGAVAPFLDVEVARLRERIARRRGFMLLAHRHEIEGLCRDCVAELHPVPARD